MRNEPYDFYTTAEDAREEIRRRWNDKELRSQVEGFIGGGILDFFGEPKAVYSSCLITPGHDVFRFLELAKGTGLEPLLLEYSDDKFVAQNLVKYLLGRMYFCDDFDLKDFSNVPKAKIVNYNLYEGKNLHEVKTLWGENLINFHHNILKSAIPNVFDRWHDFSPWFKTTRHLTEYYYLYYLSLFICHGVLFENIEIDGREAEFSKDKILPSFYKLREMFGVNPLICPLIPTETYEDLHWWCYPSHIRELLPSGIKCK